MLPSSVSVEIVDPGVAPGALLLTGRKLSLVPLVGQTAAEIIQGISPDEQDIQGTSPDEQGIQGISPDDQGIQDISPDEQDVQDISPDEQDKQDIGLCRQTRI